MQALDDLIDVSTSIFSSPDDGSRYYNWRCESNAMCDYGLKCCMGYHTNVYDPTGGANTTGYVNACDFKDSDTCKDYSGKWVVPFFISLGGAVGFCIFMCIMACCYRVCKESRRRMVAEHGYRVAVECPNCHKKKSFPPGDRYKLQAKQNEQKK